MVEKHGKMVTNCPYNINFDIGYFMKDLTSFQKAVGRSIDSRQGFKTVKNHRIFFGLFPSFLVHFFPSFLYFICFFFMSP